MKSFCIKSNDISILNFLFEEFKTFDIEEISFSKNKFKIYNNIIIHYSGTDINTFYEKLATYITNSIIKFYENKILKKVLSSNYFYFLSDEQSDILKIAIELVNSDEKEHKKDLIYLSVLNYLNENNKSMIIDGFVRFRLKDYIDILSYVIDLSVNNYLIKREYYEFIDLLKVYISSHKSTCEIVHLIYLNNESILLDENYNLIDTDSDIFNAKYLSDITFSSNDYALNTLLNMLPKKIRIHILDYQDEFINTLKLIFEKRISFCNNCKICQEYKKSDIKI